MDQMLLFFYVNIEQKYTLSIVPGYIRPLLLLSSQFYRWYCPVLLNWLYIISILIVFIFIFLEFVSKLALQIMVQHSNSIKNTPNSTDCHQMYRKWYQVNQRVQLQWKRRSRQSSEIVQMYALCSRDLRCTNIWYPHILKIVLTNFHAALFS